MEKVLIGSSAIKHHFPNFNREPKDIDYAIRSQKISGSDCMSIPLVVDNSDTEIASAEMLLTLKISHIFFNDSGERNWEKHSWDIQFLLSQGVDYDYELMLELKEFWTTHYGKLRRSNLNQSASDFFNNAINKPNGVDHDDLHKILNPIPIYTRVLEDGAEVNLDPAKFTALTHEEKLDFIREEVMVMAYERYRTKYYKAAYYQMLKKFIRLHVPMFAFDFMIRHWLELDRPRFNFIELINDKLND